MSISAAADMLKLMESINGAEGGHIARPELLTFEQDSLG